VIQYQLPESFTPFLSTNWGKILLKEMMRGNFKKGLMLLLPRRNKRPGLLSYFFTPAYILLICIVLLWSPFVMHYYCLGEADFLKSCCTFENTDLHNLPDNPTQQSFIYVLKLVLQQGIKNDIIDFFYFRSPFFDQATIKLRC
jgi:hypothetical protein